MKLFFTLAAALCLATVASAQTISSTNFAWRTNVAADADLTLVENTNRPSPFKTIAVTIANLFSNRVARGSWDFNGFPFTNSPLVIRSNTLPLWHFTTNGHLVPGVNKAFRIGNEAQNMLPIAIQSFAFELSAAQAGGYIEMANGGMRWGGVHLTNDGSNPNLILSPSGTGTGVKLYFGRVSDAATHRINNKTTGEISFENAGGQTNIVIEVSGVSMANSNGLRFATDPLLANGTKDVGLRRYGPGTLMVSDAVALGGLGGIRASNVVITGTAETNNFISPLTYSRTNDFVLNTYYTNSGSTAWITVGLDLTAGAGEDPRVRLMLDENADGTFEWNELAAELAPTQATQARFKISELIPAGARFMFTNVSVSGSVLITTRSSRWRNF